MKGKYVVGLMRDGHGVSVVAMIFNDAAIHADVAVRVFGGKEYILGAGFLHVYFENGDSQVRHYGQSDSLGIKSRLQDLSFLEAAVGLREYPDLQQARIDQETVLQAVERKYEQERASGQERAA